MTTFFAPPNRTDFVLNIDDTLNVLINGRTDNTTINNGGAENVTAGYRTARRSIAAAAKMFLS